MFVILKAPYERIQINFIALMTPTSKMQTLINSLFSTNFSVWWFQLLYRYDRLSLLTNCQTHVKHHNIFRQSSVPQKLLNCHIKVVLSFFFNCRERRRIYKVIRRIWRIMTYVFDIATIVCWLPRIFAKRFLLGTFYSKFNSFETENYAL